jgi:hypothetical protein
METTEQTVDEYGQRWGAIGRLAETLKILEQAGSIASDRDEREVREGIEALTQMLEERRQALLEVAN